jgi:glycosyltransferase involved in cell wall biosynthesis
VNILYLSADRGIPIRGDKGAAVHVRSLSDAFARAGHGVTIVTPRPGPADGPAPLARIIEAPLPPLTNNDESSREAQARAYQPHFLAAARQELAAGQYGLIYERYSLWSNAGALLARASSLPLLLEVNAPLRLEAARYRRLDSDDAAAAIEAAQFAAAAAILVVSDELKRYVMGQGAPAEKVHVLPNAVDPALFHPAVTGGHIRYRHRLHDRIIVGFVGRPRPWHDLETLLVALDQLRQAEPRYHLMLVGQADEAIQRRIGELGLADTVTLTGPVPHAEVPAHIAAFDVAVAPHPALPDFYFSPLKLFEYLACGVPVVATAIGQISQIIRPGESGYLYPPGDAAALAAAITRLLADPGEARAIAWRGAAWVLANHTWDGNAARVIGLAQPPADLPAEAVESPATIPPVSLPILDDKLRQRLYRATRTDLALPLLADHLTTRRNGRRSRLKEVAGINILKYKPGRRCVLAYELIEHAGHNGQTAQRRVIGKVFRDERGQRLFALQERLWRDGFGPDADDDILVPRPLAYIPRMRMLVQEAVPGATLSQRAHHPDRRALICRSAEGIAKLHRAESLLDGNDPGLEPYSLASELANLKRFEAELARTRPAEAPRINELRRALDSWAQRLPAGPVAPIHRDYYYSQVLFDWPRLTLIDFDLLALGDPALDVANFAAHLFFLGLDQLGDWFALAGDAALFVDAYTLFRPVDEGFGQRLAFYEAATFFRLLNVVAPRPGLAHLFPTILRQTMRHLEAA